MHGDVPHELRLATIGAIGGMEPGRKRNLGARGRGVGIAKGGPSACIDRGNQPLSKLVIVIVKGRAAIGLTPPPVAPDGAPRSRDHKGIKIHLRQQGAGVVGDEHALDVLAADALLSQDDREERAQAQQAKGEDEDGDEDLDQRERRDGARAKATWAIHHCTSTAWSAPV